MLVDRNGGKYAFADMIGVSYEAVRQWCIGENLPDGKRLLAIHEKFGVSIDWLLTGQARGSPPPDAMSGWPPAILEACRTVRTILDSDDAVTAEALLMNIKAFAQAIEHQTVNRALADDVERLKEDIQEIKSLKLPTGTDSAA